MKIDNIHKILMTNIDRDCKQERILRTVQL